MNQQELLSIFAGLKKLLKKYENQLKPKVDLDSTYDLWSSKPLEIGGRKRKEVYLTGLIIQSRYVGLYYMPIYTDSTLEEVFPPELLRLLKGKACFHISRLDEQLEKQIAHALKVGYQLYRKRGWI